MSKTTAEIQRVLVAQGRPDLAVAVKALGSTQHRRKVTTAASSVSSLAKQALKQLNSDATKAFKPSHEILKKIRDAIKGDRMEWRGDEDAKRFMQEFDDWPDTLLSATDDVRDDDLIKALTSLSKSSS